MWYQKNLQVASRGGKASALGATNAAEVNGADFDRTSGILYNGGRALVAGSATLQSGATLSFIGNYQHGDATNAYTDVGDVLSTTVVGTGPSGGGAVNFQLDFPRIDLSKCKKFVRIQYTPIFSSTGTDTSVFAGAIVVGGGQNNPAV